MARRKKKQPFFVGESFFNDCVGSYQQKILQSKHSETRILWALFILLILGLYFKMYIDSKISKVSLPRSHPERIEKSVSLALTLH